MQPDSRRLLKHIVYVSHDSRCHWHVDMWSLNFGAVTSHTAGNYIICDVAAAAGPQAQKIQYSMWKQLQVNRHSNLKNSPLPHCLHCAQKPQDDKMFWYNVKYADYYTEACGKENLYCCLECLIDFQVFTLDWRMHMWVNNRRMQRLPKTYMLYMT